MLFLSPSESFTGTLFLFDNELAPSIVTVFSKFCCAPVKVPVTSTLNFIVNVAEPPGTISFLNVICFLS